MPSDWTPDEIDAGALSIYPGPDEMKAAGELTLDAGGHRALAATVARLRSTRGANPGRLGVTRIGHYRLFAFAVHATGPISFADSGFHTQPGDQLRVGAFRAGGRTVTVFEIVSRGHRAAAFHRAAMRILRTVRPH